MEPLWNRYEYSYGTPNLRNSASVGSTWGHWFNCLPSEANCSSQQPWICLCPVVLYWRAAIAFALRI